MIKIMQKDAIPFIVELYDENDAVIDMTGGVVKFLVKDGKDSETYLIEKTVSVTTPTATVNLSVNDTDVTSGKYKVQVKYIKDGGTTTIIDDDLYIEKSL